MAIHSSVLDLFNAGHYAKAISLARNSSSDLSSDPLLSKLVAGCYFQIGEYSTAINLLGSLEAIFFNDLDYLSLYAAACRRVGHFSKSQSLFQKALEISPDSHSIKNNYANLLIDLKEFDQARVLLESVINENPSHPDATLNINRLNYILSENIKRSNLSSAIISSGSSISFADPLLLAFADSEVSSASKRYKLKPTHQATDEFPPANTNGCLSDLINLAEQACTNKQFSFALKLCSQALNSFGPSAQIYDCASDAYVNIKKFHEAEICLLHSIVLGGETPKRLLNLVSFACIRRDFQLAKTYLEKAAALDPSYPQLAAISKTFYDKNHSFPFNFVKDWINPSLTISK
ncbi:tetratricopeptide repeat protein [Synechococcus sp. AH-601-P18]|nr:tetratricopeptide repeat protein [Synechococcus sp. AH-601-P18]